MENELYSRGFLLFCIIRCTAAFPNYTKPLFMPIKMKYINNRYNAISLISLNTSNAKF